MDGRSQEHRLNIKVRSVAIRCGSSAHRRIDQTRWHSVSEAGLSVSAMEPDRTWSDTSTSATSGTLPVLRH